MLRCARGGENSSDFRHPTSSNDGYDSSSSGSDTGHISKRTNKDCTLHCTCFCSTAHGKISHKGHKSRNTISSRCRGNKQGTGLQHFQGINENLCRCNQSARITCTRSKINSKDPCSKHRVKRRKKPARDHQITRKRRFEYTEESTCTRINLPKINLDSPCSTSNLDLMWNNQCLKGTPQENMMLADKDSTADGEIFTQTPTRSALSVQSADKTGQRSSIEESIFIKYKEAEGCGFSTSQSQLLSACYDHLQINTKHLRRETRNFDLNVAVDETLSILDASMTPALQLGLDESLENFQSLVPRNDLATCQSDKNMLEDPQLGISEEAQANFQMLTQIPKGVAKCRAKRKLFATNDESHFQRESLPDSEKLCKEAIVASFSETQDEDIKIKENSQKMPLQSKERDQDYLKASPRLMEEVIFEESSNKQDEDLQSEHNEFIPATSSAHDTQDNVMLVGIQAKHKLFAINEEIHFQRESLPDSEKFCKEAIMASFSETQDKDIKMKENSQRMPLQSEERDQECLNVSPRLMEEVIFERSSNKQDEDIQAEHKEFIPATSSAHNTQDNVMLVGIQGTRRKARKKRPICKASLVELSANGSIDGIEVVRAIAGQQQASSVRCSFETEIFQENAEMVSEKLSLKNKAKFEPQRWDSDILCDLCHRGPSLSLGEWYSCCCGSRLQHCSCSVVPSKYDNNEDSCSGKVHKLCALWSIKAYTENDDFEGLSNIVTCGKLLKCARCQKNGATLTCVANNCTRVFHYPCADMLSSKLRCHMWIGPQFFVACHEHRHDTQLRGVENISPNFKTALKRLSQRLESSNASKIQSSNEQGDAECKNQSNQFQNKDLTIQISSDSDNMSKIKCDASILHCDSHNYKQQCGSALNFSLLRQGVTTRSLHYFGNNILSEDISRGSETLVIPCTNDVDSTPAPSFTYIIRSRYLARAKTIFNSLLLKQENFALPCKGCSCGGMDDPHGKISCHHFPINGHRHNDTRIDWLGQPMFGRLSYDKYGRLQAGPETDIVECNSRCPCDYTCLNRELQKGLRLHLEVFRTEAQEWAVRTTEGIPRGKFVVEFAGEILSHEEAHRRRGECNTLQLRCFSSPSHLDGSLEDLLVIDWYRMSNVARFIGQSGQGNLRIHRVYTQIKDTRFYRVGLYASHDIEIGERLSYEASNWFSCKHTTINFPLTTARRSDRLLNCPE